MENRFHRKDAKDAKGNLMKDIKDYGQERC